MKLLKQTAATLLLFFIFHNCFAQSDSTKPQKVQFKISLNYNSGLHYYGRTDSLKSTGFFPLAEVWLTKNIYMNAAPVFVHNSVQSFDYAGSVTSLGYQQISKHWLTNLSILKPFYKQSSELVQSALKLQGSANFSYLNPVMNFTAGGDVKWSDRADLGATAGIDHIFKHVFPNRSVVVIDPSLYAYAGSQNFSTTYYKKKTGFLGFPAGTETVTEESKRFNILAYEASVPLIYAKGKWLLIITPAYVMPQHLLKGERGEQMFYGTVGVKRTI